MQFRGYHVDDVHRTVIAPGGRVTRLEPKAFDLLAYFAAHPNETLSRDQLIADVWGGKFVTDDAVMVAVYALRQAFDDDSRSPKFIETIRGRGYRWIAEEDALPLAPPPKRARSLTALWAALIASGAAALVWGTLRPPQPMPSMERTGELVRAHARGLFFSERSTLKDLEEARIEFRKAILVDNRFAEPHAALAETCVRLIELGAPDIDANEKEARQELKQALELAPKSAISQGALASVQFVLDRDADKAEQSFRYAMDLDPSLPDIHRRYSYLLGASGRFAEATEQARIASQMQPASSSAIGNLAWTYALAGDLENAERYYREALRLDPASAGALLSLGFCLELRNSPDAAMQSYRRAMQINGISDDALALYDREFKAGGLRRAYAAWLEKLKTNKNAPRFLVAFYAARAGRPAEAIEYLRQSVQRREPGTLWIAVHPAFAPLRDQREFAALVASSFHTR
jgi:Tfp pilus assembly protein PilF